MTDESVVRCSWSDIVYAFKDGDGPEWYKRNALESLPFEHSSSSRLVNKQRKDIFLRINQESIEDTLRNESVQIKDCYTTKLSFDCPICNSPIVSDRSYRYLRCIILAHFKHHDISLQARNGMIGCSICYVYVKRKGIKKHYKKEHPDVEWIDPEGDDQFVDYNSTLFGKMKDVVDLIKNIRRFKKSEGMEKECEHICQSSSFKTNPEWSSVDNWHQLQIDEYKAQGTSALFRFQISSKRGAKYTWRCGLCNDSEYSSETTVDEFNNIISLRMYALRHLSYHHSYIQGLADMIDKEWDLMESDIGIDCRIIGGMKLYRRCFHTQRSLSSYYSLPFYSNTSLLINEMIRRSPFIPKSSRTEEYSICLQCLCPIRTVKLGVHFEFPHHSHLLPNNSQSEFRVVDEIAEESTLTMDNFPFILLRYSIMYRIRDRYDVDPLEMYKWRCILPCSDKPGHVDDVLEFPSVLLLKMHALRHMKEYHDDVFHESWLNYEFDLIQNEAKSKGVNLDLRTHTPYVSTGRGEFDLCDPNDFVFPQQMSFLPTHARDDNIKVCGFCFWCGIPQHFIDHIKLHGFREDCAELLDNRKADEDNSLKVKPRNRLKPKEIGRGPYKLLGKEGKKLMEKLKTKREKEDRIVEQSDDRVESIEIVAETDDDPTIENNNLINDNIIEASDDVLSVTDIFGASTSQIMSQETEDDENISLAATSTIDTTSICETNIDSDTTQLLSSKNATEQLNKALVSENTQPQIQYATSEGSSDSGAQLRKDLLPSVQENGKDLRKTSFIWEGPAPDDITDKELMYLSEAFDNGKCTMCYLNQGGFLKRQKTTEGREEVLLAHLICCHWENELAKKIIDRKRYHIATNDKLTPTIFLLSLNGGRLKCSLCRSFSTDRLRCLYLHWTSCCQREKLAKICKTPNLRTPSFFSTECPLSKCKSRWKASYQYPPHISQLMHIFASHTSDKEAYQVAIKIGEDEKCSSMYPYLNVEKSFGLSINSNRLIVQCSLCPLNFKTPNELTQHARRYHATASEIMEYSMKERCPFGCKMYRSTNNVSNRTSLIVHLIKKHFSNQKAVEWIIERKESLQNVINEEKYFKFDLVRSVGRSLQEGVPCLICSHCERQTSLVTFSQHLKKCINCDFTSVTKTVIKENQVALLSSSKPKRASSQFSENKCPICKRCVPIQSGCDDEIGIVLHIFANHQDQSSLDYLLKLDVNKIASIPPFLDLEASMSSENQEYKWSPTCALCKKKLRDVRGLSKHYKCVHRNKQEYDTMIAKETAAENSSIQSTALSCPVCNRKIASNAKDNVEPTIALLAHCILSHRLTEETRSVLSTYKNNKLYSSYPYLAGDVSLRSGKFHCSICGPLKNFKAFKALKYHASERHSEHGSTVAASGDKSKEINQESEVISLPLVKMECSDVDSENDIGFRSVVCSEKSNESILSQTSTKKNIHMRPDVVRRKTVCIPTLPEELSSERSNEETMEETNSQVSTTDTTRNIDKEKWRNCFQRYGKLEESLRIQRINNVASSNISNELPSTLSHDSAEEECSLHVEPPAKKIKIEVNAERLSINNVTPTKAASSCEKETPRRSPRLIMKREATREKLENKTMEEKEKNRMEENNDLTPSSSDASSDDENYEDIGEELSDSNDDYEDDDDDDDEAVVLDIPWATKTEQLTPCRNQQQEEQTTTSREEIDGETIPIMTNETNRMVNKNVSNWLQLDSPSSVTPVRVAKMYKKSDYMAGLGLGTTDANLKAVLENMLTDDGEKANITPIETVPTLKDLLPQERVKALVASSSKHPPDISHIKEAHSYKCASCSYAGRSVMHVRTHVKLVHSSILPSDKAIKLVPCPHCSQILQSRAKLFAHIGSYHSKVEKPYPCGYCSSMYSSKLAVRQHENRVHESSLFLDPSLLICDICNEKFQSKRCRDIHRTRHFNPVGALGKGYNEGRP